MPAKIIPISTATGTRYALIADGATVETFNYLTQAAMYALLEGYEVTP